MSATGHVSEWLALVASEVFLGKGEKIYARRTQVSCELVYNWRMDIPFDKLKKLLQKMPAVKLGYFFGSRAENSAGPLSDYDFAFYLEESGKEKRFEIRLTLLKHLTKLFQTDDIDVVILNDAQATELKYNIIKSGILFYEQEPFKLLIEPRILNEYFDFHSSLLRYGLTKA